MSIILLQQTPTTKMATVAYMMANLKRFGATDKSIPKFGNVKEDVQRMFGTST